MEHIKRIPPTLYLIFSLVLITIAIASLYLENFILAIVTLIIGIISLIAWTFLGLFEEKKKT